jgi:V/A-type H+/Na+-transporting ATPase subunit E
MEELRSTDILDKEIESDARKKAEHILIDADAECQKVLDAVDERVKIASEQKKTYYAAKLAQVTRDAEAALPLEKERFFVSFESRAVADAISAYLMALNQERRISLVIKMLEKSKNALAGKKVHAFVFGFDCSLAEKALKKELGNALVSCVETSFEKSGEAPAALNTLHEGIILESEDHFIRCRLTLDQLIGELENTYNYELTSTLFGGRLPE